MNSPHSTGLRAMSLAFVLFWLSASSAFAEAPVRLVGPVESLSQAIELAEQGNWDEHFAFSIHPQDLPKLEKVMQRDREGFLAKYRERKIPVHKQILEQIETLEPVRGEIDGEPVAFFMLGEPLGRIVGLLMYQADERYVFKNRSAVLEKHLSDIHRALGISEKTSASSEQKQQ